MNEKELREAVALGREQRTVEFKGPGRRNEKPFAAKVIRAMLGMANNAHGGVVVLGVTDELDAVGLSDDELCTWTYDDLADRVSKYADPYLDFDLSTLEMDEKSFVVLAVTPFDAIPVICKSDFTPVNKKPTLRKGALYVRRRGKNETVEVPTHIEMREVLDRAAEKIARRMVSTYENLMPIPAASIPPDDTLFDKEFDDLDNGTLQKIRTRGAWTIRIRPTEYDKKRIESLSELEQAIGQSRISSRGFEFPYTDAKPRRGAEFLDQDISRAPYLEYWRATKSGQFIAVRGIREDWLGESETFSMLGGQPFAYLSVEDSVLCLTEAFAFASQWCRALQIGPEVRISISVNRLKSRKLAAQPTRIFRGVYTSTAETFEWETRKPLATIFSSPAENALEAALELFELFGWDDKQEIIRDIQREHGF